MWFKSYRRNPFQAEAILDVATILAPRVTCSDALAKSFQYDLSYICAKFSELCENVLKAPNCLSTVISFFFFH